MWRAQALVASRGGVLTKAIWAGLLTDGSSYSPTPSQRRRRQWLVLLAFVPDYSGAPVRGLHPLPVSFTHIAIAHCVGPQFRTRSARCQGIFCQLPLKSVRQKPPCPTSRNSLHPQQRRLSRGLATFLETLVPC